MSEPDFSREEYEARLARLRGAMRQAGAVGMLIDDAEILAYYTGHERSVSFYRACIVPLFGEPLMVLRAGLRDHYDNITGYTLGYYSQQPLRSSDFTRVFLPNADWRLEEGMIFHMYTSTRGVWFFSTSPGPRRT